MSAEDVKLALEFPVGGLDEGEEGSESEEEFVDGDSESEDDIGSEMGEKQTEEEESEDEQSLSDPGSIVWVLWGGRRYPAKVILMSDVPEGLRASMRKDDGRSVIVKFYGDNDFSRVDLRKVTELGQNIIDLKWSRFTGILEKYNLALADLKYK